MATGRVDPHGDRLVGAIGDDHALADLLYAGRVLARRCRLGRTRASARLGARAHPYAAPGLRLGATLGDALLMTFFGAASRTRLGLGGLGRPAAAAALLG